MRVDVYNQKNEKIGTAELRDKIFAARFNPDLVHQALAVQTANSREKLSMARNRGEVRGGGKKPWRQKGTGRARHGSIRSPLWKGGGVTHGPTRGENFKKKINKKMKRLAISAVLSQKHKEGKLKLVDEIKIKEVKTKELGGIIKNLIGSPSSILIIPSFANKMVGRAAANLQRVGALSPLSLNVRDLLKYNHIILEKKAAEEIAQHYSK